MSYRIVDNVSWNRDINTVLLESFGSRYDEAITCYVSSYHIGKPGGINHEHSILVAVKQDLPIAEK